MLKMAARYSNATIVILQQLYGDTVVDTDGYGSVRRSCRYSGADLTDLGSLGGSFLFLIGQVLVWKIYAMQLDKRSIFTCQSCRVQLELTNRPA